MLKSKRILAVILALALLVVSTVVSMATQSDDTAATLKAAFAAYVEKNGNNILYKNVVSGVAEELEALGSTLTADDISLAEGDFYIKHAVDGCIDEDPDPTTRINIPGSDGAAAAIFTVGGVRYAMVEVIPHEVENLGLLAVTKNDVNASGELYAVTFTEPGKPHKMIVSGEAKQINNTVKLYSGSTSDLVAIVMLSDATDISFRINGDKSLVGVKAMVIGGNITSASAQWTGTNMTSLKYLQLPKNFTKMSGGFFAQNTVLENVNFDDLKLESFTWDSFKKEPMLYEVSAHTEIGLGNLALTDGPEGRNYVILDQEMTFAQAAAYAASNASTYKWVDNYTEETLTTAILNKVVHTGLKTAWNDTLSFDKATYTLSGTLTLTSGADSFDIPLSVVNDNISYDVEDIKTAFKNYVKENGNSITYSNIVAGVAAELKELGSSYVAEDLGLAQSDFYIKHAVDGVIDEDPDPTTRINIPGSDGAVVATFTVNGQRLSMFEIIPHEVENLGLLAVTKNAVDANGLVTSTTFTETGKKHKMIVSGDAKQISDNLSVSGGSTEDLVAVVLLSDDTDIKYRINQNKTLTGVKAMVIGGNITSASAQWTGTNMTGLKYLQLPKNFTKMSGGFFAQNTVLENVNFDDLKLESFTWDSFKKEPMLYEVSAHTEISIGNNTLSEGPEGRNYVILDQEMTFAQAVAYAISNASTYKWDANYTEESVTAAVLNKVLCSSMTYSWNDTLNYDEDNLVLSGTFTLTNGIDSFDIALTVADDNFEISTEDLKAAFDAYVEANGNEILYVNVLDGVKAELNKAGISTPNNYISLAQKDFYIKHAVDGCIDEDPNPETRINIPGSDGAVSAVFTVGGVRIPLIKAIPHTVENFGVLAVTKNDVNENGELYAVTFTEPGKKHKLIVSGDAKQINNTLKLYSGSVEDLVAVVMLSDATDISLRINQDKNLAGVKAMVIGGNITSASAQWTGTNMTSLKYLQLPKNFTKPSGGFFAQCPVLENVNFEDLKLESFPYDSFKVDPMLYEISAHTEITLGNIALTDGPQGRNYVILDQEMTFAQAMAYAQSNAGSFEYTIGMSADEIADKIIGGKINYSAGLTADWNDTYNFDTKALTVSGTLTVTDSKGNTMDIDFFRDFGAEMDVPEMKYLEFDTTDTALAVELDDITDVEEVGVEVSITTANGTNTYTYATDYVNAAAKNNKAFIALADKVYYCDVDMNGVIDGNDLITLTKNLLLDNESNATADLKEDGLVNILDFIKLKKLMAAKELEFSSLAFTDYTYAFAISELASAESVENVTIKPYCMISGLKFYGEESSLAQFSSDWTVLVKP